MNSGFNTIKELVIETCMNEGFFPSYERLTSLVLKCFPSSKWQKTHYSWYKSKIKRGEITVPGLGTSTEYSISDDESDNDVQESIDASLSLVRV